LDQAVGYGSYYFGSGCWLLFTLFWIRLLVTVHIILDQAIGECSGDFGTGCWLLFPFFGSGCWLLFPFFGSGYQLLFLLFWIKLLVTVSFILDQAVGYCFHYFGSDR
jgi:hypothetical protein